MGQRSAWRECQEESGRKGRIRSDRRSSEAQADGAGLAGLQQRIGNREVVRLLGARAVESNATSPSGLPTGALLQVQRTLGNRAVIGTLARPGNAPVVQREFEDQDKVAEDAVGYMRGPAGKPETAVASAERKSPFGELDGEMTSGVQPHAFVDGGRVGESTWHHCGGQGGKGVENLGDATLVAPVYKSKPAANGKPAEAWIQRGTGTVKVKRSFYGVTHGAQGAYTQPPPGVVWMSPRARKRVDEHEREHTKKAKEAHDLYIEPLEKRISKYRGLMHETKKAASPAAAQAALQTEIDWNTSIQNFANMDTTQNTPMGPVDQTDLAKADFYQDYQTSAKFQQQSNCTIYEGVGVSKRGKT